MRAALHQRIFMVIEITSKPCIFFHRQLDNIVVEEPFLSYFIFKKKTSDSVLALTLGRVAHVLDWAYLPNNSGGGANGSPWW